MCHKETVKILQIEKRNHSCQLKTFQVQRLNTQTVRFDLVNCNSNLITELD